MALKVGKFGTNFRKAAEGREIYNGHIKNKIEILADRRKMETMDLLGA